MVVAVVVVRLGSSTSSWAVLSSSAMTSAIEVLVVVEDVFELKAAIVDNDPAFVIV